MLVEPFALASGRPWPEDRWPNIPMQTAAETCIDRNWSMLPGDTIRSRRCTSSPRARPSTASAASPAMASRAATAPVPRSWCRRSRRTSSAKSANTSTSANCAAAGIFAFKSRKQAEDFVASDRSAAIAQASLLASYTIDNQATVDPWLGQVSESNIYNTINHLQGYQNRYYASAHRQDLGGVDPHHLAGRWRAAAATSPPNCSPPAATARPSRR